MRDHMYAARSLGLIVVGALALASCAALPFGGNDRQAKKAPAPEAGGTTSAETTAASPEVAAEADGVERIEEEVAPKRKGFGSRLARVLGSESTTPNVGPCPAVRVLYDNQRFVDLTGPERFENVGYTGEIQNVTSSCRYVGDDPIEVQLQANMAFGKGPKAAPEGRDVVYWIAVTRKDIAPISRERYTQRIVVPAGQDRIFLNTPQTTITIPRANAGISGINFEVLIGFELTPDQLEFNRNGKRFRVDAGAPR